MQPLSLPPCFAPPRRRWKLVRDPGRVTWRCRTALPFEPRGKFLPPNSHARPRWRGAVRPGYGAASTRGERRRFAPARCRDGVRFTESRTPLVPRCFRIRLPYRWRIGPLAPTLVRRSCVARQEPLSPGPYRSFRELSLAGSVDPVIWCPPTFVGNSGIERFNGLCGFALLFVLISASRFT